MAELSPRYAFQNSASYLIIWLRFVEMSTGVDNPCFKMFFFFYYLFAFYILLLNCQISIALQRSKISCGIWKIDPVCCSSNVFAEGSVK